MAQTLGRPRTLQSHHLLDSHPGIPSTQSPSRPKSCQYLTENLDVCKKNCSWVCDTPGKGMRLSLQPPLHAKSLPWLSTTNLGTPDSRTGPQVNSPPAHHPGFLILNFYKGGVHMPKTKRKAGDLVRRLTSLPNSQLETL